jgi:hypothetical protein
MRTRENIVKWLLAGDPAIRWKTLRDLTDASPAEVSAERTRVAREGWGAALLAAQRPDGSWAPSEGPADAADPGWMITIRTLTLLKDMGADPADTAVRAAIARVKPLRFKWHDNKAFFEGESEPCLNGRILGLGAYFGEPNEPLLRRLLSEQLPDGGWNCDAPHKSHVSSFDTTICVLEGLLAWEEAMGFSDAVTAARTRAHAYLLERRLMFGLRSGDIIDKRFLSFGWHPNWQYDVLRALDYFRDAAVSDERMADAIEVVKDRRHQNGLWPLNRMGPGATGYVTEAEVGAPSRWNTLRAMRVLDSWAATELERA